MESRSAEFITSALTSVLEVAHLLKLVLPLAPVASVPQMTLPLPSVSSASEQDRSVETLSPPETTCRPARVEVAVVDARWSEMPPTKVEVPAPVAYIWSASMSPEASRFPAVVEVPVESMTRLPVDRRMPLEERKPTEEKIGRA